MPAPSNLRVTQGLQQLTLNWEAVPSATSYNLYYSLSQGVTTGDTKISGIVVNSYIHTGLLDLKYRYYRVAAVVGVEGNLSNEVNEIPRLPLENPFVAPAGTRYPTRKIINVREVVERLDPTRHDPTIEYDMGNGRNFKRTGTNFG